MSISIIGVLIALLLPSLSGVRELTRRVMCASNSRQHGLGLAMFVEDSKGQFPTSKFAAKNQLEKGAPQYMMVARTGEGAWDGLGGLFINEYLNAPQVFYCPSHTGDHPYSRYASSFIPGIASELVINYHYRSIPVLPIDQTDRIALIADGLQTQADFNHRVGANVLRADYSVKWFADPSRTFSQLLPDSVQSVNAAEKVDTAWAAIDTGLVTPKDQTSAR